MYILEIILLVVASGIGIYLIITNIEITDLLKGINVQKYIEALEFQKEKYYTKKGQHLESQNTELQTKLFVANGIICDLVKENHTIRRAYDPNFVPDDKAAKKKQDSLLSRTKMSTRTEMDI